MAETRDGWLAEGPGVSLALESLSPAVLAEVAFAILDGSDAAPGVAADRGRR